MTFARFSILNPRSLGSALAFAIALGGFSSAVHAQDADRDGVPDTNDLCPGTTLGLDVDGAGCDNFCEVVDNTSDVFLRSRLLEVGTAVAGSFGAVSDAPVGWHPRSETSGRPDDRLGFVADPDRTDWTDAEYDGDFFTPGSPEEGFGLSVGGTDYFNSTLQGVVGIPGDFTGTRVACRTSVCGQRGGGSVFWEGEVDGIEVEQTYSVLNEGLFILIEVTLTNTTMSPETVTYLRNVDPDNQQPLTGDFDTLNTIVSQGDGSATSLAHVTATTAAVPGTATASYIALISSDPDARVTFGGFSNRDPDAIFGCTAGFSCVEGNSDTDDEAISLAVRKLIPAMGSVSFTLAYTLDDVAVVDSVICTEPSICGNGLVEGTEACDDGARTPGDGCSAFCDIEDGYECMGEPSMCVEDCGDGRIIGDETCDDGNDDAGDGCSATCRTEPGSVCTGMPSVCGVCVDTMSGSGTDLGCRAAAPFCIGSGTTAFCAPCINDTGAGQDSGCNADNPVCDNSVPAMSACIACEDSAAGVGVDNGCEMDNPVCGTTGAGTAVCVECGGDDDCGVGTVCDASGMCVPGCTNDADCAATPAVPVCDVPARMCVECLRNAQCDGTEVCGAMNVCESVDTDSDGVPDERDDDDDNDGIPDAEEVDEDSLGDTNGNGILDFEDAALVVCPDSGGDGVCDELPLGTDFDQDGIANHLDRDADGDGITDTLEGGGTDDDGNGIVDGFSDLDGDGLHDPLLADALPLPSTDGDASPDFLDLDADGDGITDTTEGGGTDVDGDGSPDEGTDTDMDGLFDELVGDDALGGPNADGDEFPDFQDVDSDGDGIEDAIEGHDDDADGAGDTTPSGADTDNDGIDDAFDPDCAGDGDCAGVLGAIAPLPNRDMSGPADWRDADSDGDGIVDAVECPRPADCADSDDDGTPDYLSLDADGDGIDDSIEGHDTDFDGVADVDPSGVDTDGDGLDDAFDGDCAEESDCGGIIGTVAPTPDLDEDMIPNFQDPDDDGDGMSTALEQMDATDYEGPAADPSDIDEDGLPNWYDHDSVGDEVSDQTESGGDRDEDDNDILDYLDPNFAPADTDGDGVVDADECPPPASISAGDCPDTDGDGDPDYDDTDDDGDGIDTADEELAGPDTDGDGIPNRLDLDSDDDGILDSIETGADTDRDGRPDAADLDSDGDGILDVVEGGGASFDADGDGRVDDETDADMNGVADSVDASPLPVPDTDGNGLPDFRDTDADGDSVPDAIEGHDADADGVADVMPSGIDSNGDGIDDAFDPSLGGTAATTPDRDGDMAPDYQDVDDDGDGVHTRFESPVAQDTDGDGTPDYLDPDDDGDDTPTADEQGDPNMDGNPDDAIDTDGDGIPDYLDPDDGGPPPTTGGGISGGALCAASTPGAGQSGFGFMVLALGLALMRRRRR